jgi:hypothetical protein
MPRRIPILSIRSAPRGILAAAAALLPMVCAVADSGEKAAKDEPVALEPVFVEAASANPWEYFAVPGFEVISHCPDDFNASYARALRRATAARAALLPGDFWGELPTPMKVVLYNRPLEPEADFLKAKPIDLAWSAGDPAHIGSGSVRQAHPVLVGDGDTYISCGNYYNLLTDGQELYLDPDSELRLAVRVPQFPGWFQAGLEGRFGLFRDRRIDSDTVVLPNAVWMSPAETAALQKDPKHPRQLLPLEAIFGGYAPEGKKLAWQAQAALVVRWGLYAREADGSDHREGFLDFVRQSAREPVTEAMFRGFLGMGYREAQARLDAYLAAAVAAPIRVPLGAVDTGPVAVREASPVEVARIIGDWGRLEGRSIGLQGLSYQQECLDQSEKLFERIKARGEGDPMFLAAFGLYALQTGDTARAREALETATGAGVVRPRAYLELARLRLEDALPSAGQGIGDLGEKEYAEIVRLLTVARLQLPSLIGCYQTLAKAMEHAPHKPSRLEMADLDAGLRLFPRNAPLAYRVATLYKGLGYPDEAKGVIDRAMAFAETDDARTRLTAFVVRDP